MKGGHHNFKQAQTTVQFLLGPIKIKDGLFMGDQFAAKDIEFIISNKVTHVINTVSKTIPNLYQRFGIQYLSVHWTEKEENIFDKKNNAINAIFEFIEQAMQMGESCLIHSMHGKSRSCAVLVAYLIKKYSWSLNKCLQFVNSKKQGLEIRNNYLAQMQELQKRIMNQCKLSMSWNQIKNQEDLILANTFYNAKKVEAKSMAVVKKNSKKKVVWGQKLVQKVSNNPQHPNNHTPNNTVSKKVKSILKGQQGQKEEEIQEKDNKNVKDDRFVSTINGNIVHVTVNNFITTDKPVTQQTPTKFYNTRPFSSDTKDRQKKTTKQASKIHPSDTNMSATMKNPYETKMIGKIGNNLKGGRKKEQPRNLMMIYDRPISAKVPQDKRKGSKQTNPVQQKLGYDMVVTNSSKKRYPSSNNRQDPYKWK